MVRTAVGLLVALLFLLRLGAPGLFEKDEPRYAQAAREMRRSGDLLVPTLGGEDRLNKPPLAYWLVAASHSVLGESELATRLPFALFGLLTTGAVYLLARRIGGGRAGLAAALVYVSTPLSVGLGRLAHPEGLLTFALVSSTILLFRAREEDFARRRTLAAAWLLMGLGFLAKGPHAVLLPPLTMAAYLAVRREWRRIPRLMFGRGLPLAIAPVAAWGALVLLREGPEVGRMWLEESLGRFLGGPDFHPEPIWFFVPVLLGGFAPWSLWLPYAAARFRKRDDRPAGIGFVVLWALVVLLFFSLSRNKTAGYVASAIAPLSVLVGVALARVRTGTALRVTGGLFLVAAAGAAIGGLGASDHPRAVAGGSALLVTACGAVAVLGTIGALALAGRARAAALTSAWGLSIVVLLLLALVVPALSPFFTLREPGTALRDAPVDSRIVNLESPRAGLLWYADRRIEENLRGRAFAAAWRGARRVVAFANADRIDRIARRHGLSIHVLWSREGREYVVVENRSRAERGDRLGEK